MLKAFNVRLKQDNESLILTRLDKVVLESLVNHTRKQLELHLQCAVRDTVKTYEVPFPTRLMR